MDTPLQITAGDPCFCLPPDPGGLPGHSRVVEVGDFIVRWGGLAMATSFVAAVLAGLVILVLRHRIPKQLLWTGGISLGLIVIGAYAMFFVNFALDPWNQISIRGDGA